MTTTVTKLMELTETALDDVLHRIEAEYEEMPGMCVTRPQAQRLWGLDSATCELALTTLLERGVVRRTRGGLYVKGNGTTGSAK